MEENYTSERRSDNVDITALWRRLCKKWYFFAISVFACVVLVILYLQIAKPQYEVLADILVNEEKDSGGGGLASLMGSSGGGFSLSGMIGGDRSTTRCWSSPLTLLSAKWYSGLI